MINEHADEYKLQKDANVQFVLFPRLQKPQALLEACLLSVSRLGIDRVCGILVNTLAAPSQSHIVLAQPWKAETRLVARPWCGLKLTT